MMIKILSALFFIFLVLFPFGQLTKIPLTFLNSPDVHLYLTDIILFLLVVSWGVSKIFQRKEKYHLPPLTKPIFIFVFIGGLSLAVNSPLFSGREVGVGFLYLLRWIFYAGLYFVLFDLKEKLPWLKKDWSCFLIIIGSMVGIFALIQYFLWPNLKALEVLQYDPHFYRAVGTFLDPGFTGIILLLTLIVIVYNGSCFKNGSCRAFSPVRHPRFVAGARREPLYASHPFCLSKLSIIIHYPLSILLYLALALTYSRASWLAFLVGMSVLAFYKKSWKIFLAAAGVLVLTWFLIPQPTGEGGKLTRTYTIQARFQNYQQAVKIFNEKPILGVGFNTLRYYQKNQPENQAGAGLDNSWLFVLATTGILGLASYLWLWSKALDKFKNPLIVSSFSALFIHAFFVNSLFYSWVMVWIWIILAMENR